MRPSSALRPLPAPPGTVSLECPTARPLRDRLRAMAADLVAGWRTDGLPPAARTAAGLREAAELLVRRAGGQAAHVGWTMVTIVSEFWRDRLAAGGTGRRLLLLPDCPVTPPPADDADGSVPRVCGPGCGLATIWAAARDGGWTVEPTGRAVAAIGGLLTGQYDGILGIARLADLEKAFGMLPAFALPTAAVPYEPAASDDPRPRSCADALAAAAIDVDWVLNLLGVAGGNAAPVGDYLPLLREAAGLFQPEALSALCRRIGLGDALGSTAVGGPIQPLDATAALSGDFLARGGKFLRPFVTLAAFDAVSADLEERRPGERRDDGPAPREAARAAAVAIEVFHKASLVHDDIEDDDTMRYGRPTLHVERGVPAAINAGDYLLGVGYRIVSGLSGLDAAAIRDVVGILSDAHVRLARGQGAELWWRDAGDRGLSPDEALAIYALKTSPAFEAAVAIGIRLGGIQPADCGAIDGYARHVGTGFQVLNDLKDWSGDLENDRRAAGDLLGGRPTLLWALAQQRLPAAATARLRTVAERAGRAAAPAAEVAAAVTEARGLYREAGVLEEAAAIAARQRQSAADAAATCRLRRLREVLEFLLDLAVPEQAPVPLR